MIITPSAAQTAGTVTIYKQLLTTTPVPPAYPSSQAVVSVGRQEQAALNAYPLSLQQEELLPVYTAKLALTS